MVECAVVGVADVTWGQRVAAGLLWLRFPSRDYDVTLGFSGDIAQWRHIDVGAAARLPGRPTGRVQASHAAQGLCSTVALGVVAYHDVLCTQVTPAIPRNAMGKVAKKHLTAALFPATQ